MNRPYRLWLPIALAHSQFEAIHPFLEHTDIRTTLDPDYRPGSGKEVNQVTNCILGLGQEVEPGSVQ